ncbi:MAG: tetratricopeptide repeat protein [Bryobacteraceae bacterium]
MNRRKFRWLWALVCLLVVLQGCWRDPATVKRRYVANGDKYFAQGKYREASLMYRSALRKDLKYGEAYSKLGESELRRGEIQTALQAFTRALELAPNDENPPSRLADIWLAYYGAPKGHNAKTLAQVESLATQLLKRNPNSYNGQRLTGFLEVARSDADSENKQAHMDAAIAAFRKADEARPNQPDLLFALAQTLNRNNQWNQAELIARRLLERNPKYWLAYDYLILQYLRHRQPDNAEQIMTLKVANDPKNAAVVVEQAGFYYAIQRKDRAEAVLQSLLAREKDFPDARVRVGDFYGRTRNYERALAVFEEGVKQGGDRTSAYRLKIAMTQVAMGLKSEAFQTVETVLKEDPKNNTALSLRAGLRLDSGDDKQTQAAINDLQMLLSRQTSNPVVRYNLGRAYQSRGQEFWPAAKMQYQEAAKRPGFLAAQIGLAQVNLQLHDFQHAIMSADDALRIDPTNPVAISLKANAQINLGNITEARNELQEAIKRSPNAPDLQFQLALANYADKKYPEALAVFKGLFDKYPTDVRLVYAMADVLIKSNRGPDALKLLQEQLGRNPQNQGMRMVTANAAVIVKQFDLAEREYRQLLEVQPKNFELFVRLGEVIYVRGQTQQALDMYRQAEALQPKHPRLSLDIALAMESLGMRHEALPYYKTILSLEPGNAVALNNLAFLMAEEGRDLDTAFTYIQKAKQQYPDDVNIADTMGWIMLKKALYDDALSIFTDLVKRDPHKALFRYHLGVALYNKRDVTGARQSLQMALALKPDKEEEAGIRTWMAKTY